MTDTLKILSDKGDAEKSSVKGGLLSAYRKLLHPLIRILVRHGVSFGEFAEVAKTVYVETATKDFALPGRKPSGSRIAILTGLTRKEVKRITDGAESVSASKPSTLSRTGRVLMGWHQDPDFTGPYGIPLELPFDGDPICFTELVRRYSGDMPARAMLEELVRVGAVEESEDGLLRGLSRLYIPEKMAPDSLERLGFTLHDLAETLDHNLNPNRREEARFERRVWTARGIAKESVPEFRALVRLKGQEFLETLDNWLSIAEANAETEEEEAKTRTGVGIYLFEDKHRGESEK